MALVVNSYGSKISYEYDYFDKELSKIIFREIKDVESFIQIDYSFLIDDSYKEKSFDVYFLAKYGLKENDIFQVFDRKLQRRIGWCIPTNALDSTDHDYASNEHFLKYAYVGVQEALRKLPDDIFTNPIDISTSSRIRISEIFHESTALLIISREALDIEDAFQLPKAIPSLLKAGYVELTKDNPSLLTLSRPSPEGNKLYVEFVSNHVDDADLIAVLLKNVAFYQSNTILQFFYLYQVVELLLECVFKHEQKLLVRELVAQGNRI